MTKQISLAAILLLSFSVHAEPPARKSPTQIDFNKMIDENDTTELQKQVANKVSTKDPAEDVKVNEDKKKVLDFVDVEIGLGEGRPVVDRRFNSTKAAVVAGEFTVKLLPKGTP